jgi:hypothetical protein
MHTTFSLIEIWILSASNLICILLLYISGRPSLLKIIGRSPCIPFNILMMNEAFGSIYIATTMHMANYVSRRLNIVCLIFKIRTFFIITFFAWLFVRIYILPICDKTCTTASFHYAGKLGPIKLALRLHMLLESLFQARKSSGHIYVCLVYRLSLCDFFIGFWNCSDSVIFFWTVPTMWYFWNCSDSVIFF